MGRSCLTHCHQISSIPACLFPRPPSYNITVLGCEPQTLQHKLLREPLHFRINSKKLADKLKAWLQSALEEVRQKALLAECTRTLQHGYVLCNEELVA